MLMSVQVITFKLYYIGWIEQLQYGFVIAGLLCRKQVSGAKAYNYVPQYLRDVLTCHCRWYLLLVHITSIILEIAHSRAMGKDGLTEFIHATDTPERWCCCGRFFEILLYGANPDSPLLTSIIHRREVTLWFCGCVVVMYTDEYFMVWNNAYLPNSLNWICP